MTVYFGSWSRAGYYGPSVPCITPGGFWLINSGEGAAAGPGQLCP